MLENSSRLRSDESLVSRLASGCRDFTEFNRLFKIPLNAQLFAKRHVVGRSLLLVSYCSSQSAAIQQTSPGLIERNDTFRR